MRVVVSVGGGLMVTICVGTSDSCSRVVALVVMSEKKSGGAAFIVAGLVWCRVCVCDTVLAAVTSE